MKIKSKTKKILVLSVMVVLLVTTGVLNFVLTDKLTNATNQAGIGSTANVVETFFASCKSERQTTMEYQFLALDATINSPNSTAGAKAAAEAEKLKIVEELKIINNIETLIKAKGFNDAIITLNDKGVNVVVMTTELSQLQRIQITDILVNNSSYGANDIHIMLYN